MLKVSFYKPYKQLYSHKRVDKEAFLDLRVSGHWGGHRGSHAAQLINMMQLINML